MLHSRPMPAAASPACASSPRNDPPLAVADAIAASGAGWPDLKSPVWSGGGPKR
jgi:hypothetical protein